MAWETVVKVDDKGRLTIPQAVRDQMRIASGDIFFLKADEALGVLRFEKAENPFDILAVHAFAEYRAGRTTSLRDFAAEHGFSLDGE